MLDNSYIITKIFKFFYCNKIICLTGDDLVRIKIKREKEKNIQIFQTTKSKIMT